MIFNKLSLVMFIEMLIFMAMACSEVSAKVGRSSRFSEKRPVSAPSSSPVNREYTEESDRDHKLRSFGELDITNARGDVSIQGWSLDKVRIKVRKTVRAESAEQAKAVFQALDYRFTVEKNKIEVSTQYGKDLSIEERLREKEGSQNRMDFLIFAPAHLNVKVWTVNGKTFLKSWSSTAEIRSNSGPIRVENSKSPSLSLRCTTCQVDVKELRGSIRAVVGDGQISLSNIASKSLYVESNSGLIKLWHVDGEQIYSSQTGAIEGQFLEGNVEFHNHAGAVTLKDVSGFVSGTTESGNVTITVRKWEFLDKSWIETVQGDVNLTLPRPFSANVDLWSLHGQTELDFPFQSTADTTFGPVPSSHVLGRVREGGELLKIYSDTGNIRVKKGD
jgi:DUF4097 and DUF4098 domain-containing protein YvlB